MATGKTLDEQLVAAEMQMQQLKRQIELMSLIKQHLTDDDNNPISMLLDFEFEGMRISIKPKRMARAEDSLLGDEGKRRSRKRGPKPSKIQKRDLKEDQIKKLEKLAFKGVKKQAAIEIIKEAWSGFSAEYWDSFVLVFRGSRERLSSSGKGAGTEWTLTAQ